MLEGLFQPTHLILILALVLIFFGPGKVTEIGASLGQGLRELRRALDGHDAPPGGAESDPANRPPPQSLSG